MSVTWRRARKAHVCCACHQTIRPRDRYHYTSIVFDGSAGSYKHCARCRMILENISAASGDYVYIRLDCGQLWEDVIGKVPDEIAALAFMTPDQAQTALETHPANIYARVRT